MNFFARLRQRFYRWVTRRQLEEFTIQQLGPLDGPVQFLEPFRDQLVVFTDRSVYLIDHNYAYGRTELRRLR